MITINKSSQKLSISLHRKIKIIVIQIMITKYDIWNVLLNIKSTNFLNKLWVKKFYQFSILVQDVIWTRSGKYKCQNCG